MEKEIRDVMWLKRLLIKLKIQSEEPMKPYYYNAVDISIVHDLVHHD